MHRFRNLTDEEKKFVTEAFGEFEKLVKQAQEAKKKELTPILTEIYMLGMDTAKKFAIKAIREERYKWND